MELDMQKIIAQFELPRYEDIPDVGLFLDQVTKYISEYLRPLGSFCVTNSMISNYVKKGLIANPVKRQYGREQIAYLFFIVVAKTVLSLEDIQLLIDLQKKGYSPQQAYQYFRMEMLNVLGYVFGCKGQLLDHTGEGAALEKKILRNAIVAVAHKIYIDQYLLGIRQGLSEQEGDAQESVFDGITTDFS